MSKIKVIICDTVCVNDWEGLASHTLKAYLMENALIRDNFCIDIMSEFFSDINKMVSKIEKEKPDIVGFSTYVWNIHKNFKVASRIKLKNNTKIVLGGPAASTLALDLLQENKFIDFIISGEGEEPFLELLTAIYNKSVFSKINGLSYRINNEIISNPPGNKYLDVNRIPPVYQNIERFSKVMVIETSRGCKNKCRHCYWGSGKDLRLLPLEKIRNEMKILFGNNETSMIYFADSDILFDSFRAIEIFKLIQDLNVREKRCIFEVNPEYFTDKIIEVLSKSSKLIFHFSFISGTERVYKACGQNLNLTRIKQNIELFKEKCKESFGIIEVLLGLPYESKKSFIENTLTYVYKIKPDNIIFQVFHVIPGTYIYDNIKKYDIKFDDPPHANRVISTSTLNRLELTEVRITFFMLSRLSRKDCREIINELILLSEQQINMSLGRLVYNLSVYLMDNMFGAEYSTNIENIKKHASIFINKLSQDLSLR